MASANYQQSITLCTNRDSILEFLVKILEDANAKFTARVCYYSLLFFYLLFSSFFFFFFFFFFFLFTILITNLDIRRMCIGTIDMDVVMTCLKRHSTPCVGSSLFIKTYPNNIICSHVDACILVYVVVLTKNHVPYI